MANNNTGSNRVLVPQAKAGLDRLKFETASEVGLANYDATDKGNLTSRQNGYVGGFMVKKMIQDWEQNNAR